MIEIIVFCLIIFLPMLLVKVIFKYKLIAGSDVLDKFYEYSKYLILKIESIEELKNYKDFNKFRNYISKNDKVFLVLHTDSKLVKAELIRLCTEEKYNKFFNELVNSIKNKELKISIFNVANATDSEKDFFWSIVSYRNFKFIKYLTINNLTYLFGFTIGILLILFNILNQKTLYSLGIPLQLSLVNIFDFGQFVLYDNLSSLGSVFYSIVVVLFFGLVIIFYAIYFFRNRKKKIGDKTLFDQLLFSVFYAIIGFLMMVISLFISLVLISIIKINFPDSKLKYTSVFTTAGDYINYTGYPKIGYINKQKSYIVGYDTNNLYFYNLEESNNKFFNFQSKEKDETLYNTCKLIFEYKEEKNRFIIILLKNKYLKSVYMKNILKKDAIITDEKPLEYFDIVIDDIDAKCQNYIEKNR